MNIRICPNCNSPLVVRKPELFGERIYHCRRCHFESTLFSEITVKNVEELKKLRLKPLKKTKRTRTKGRNKGRT